jgi:hypothetical protein
MIIEKTLVPLTKEMEEFFNSIPEWAIQTCCDCCFNVSECHELPEKYAVTSNGFHYYACRDCIKKYGLKIRGRLDR